MVRIGTFAVEAWMDEYETTPGVLNVAETCCDSVSVDELVALASQDSDGSTPISSPIKPSARLGYGAIRGSAELRRRIADLYKSTSPGSGASSMPGSGLVDAPVSPDQVVVTPGAIGANFLALYTLIGPGDHVVCIYPTYQQLYAVPESLGAEVSLWHLREEKAFVPDIAELEVLIRPNTKAGRLPSSNLCGEVCDANTCSFKR